MAQPTTPTARPRAEPDARRGRLRVLHDGAAGAAWNMAADAALLEAGGPPTLRLYRWSPHAVSLGYFQRAADFIDVPADVPLVRRATGGGAIHHGDELTFSLTVDSSVLPGELAASYALVHDAVARALADVGVRCHRSDGGVAQGARPTERWCFASPVRDDLVTDRGKLCGSAQRRVRGVVPRVLHHGSLVLRRPALTPFVAAAEDQVPVDDALRTALAAALVGRVAEVLELTPEPGGWSDRERALAAAIERRVYAAPEHLARR